MSAHTHAHNGPTARSGPSEHSARPRGKTRITDCGMMECGLIWRITDYGSADCGVLRSLHLPCHAIECGGARA
eukprot:7074707-Alexandrium_andersonii.AAC.1